MLQDEVIALRNTLKAYKRVIADLESQADTYEPNALDETLSKLNYRVWEIENIWGDELAKLEASMKRHPSHPDFMGFI
jgi:hypothetical protein